MPTHYVYSSKKTIWSNHFPNHFTNRTSLLLISISMFFLCFYWWILFQCWFVIVRLNFVLFLVMVMFFWVCCIFFFFEKWTKKFLKFSPRWLIRFARLRTFQKKQSPILLRIFFSLPVLTINSLKNRLPENTKTAANYVTIFVNICQLIFVVVDNKE